MILLNLFLSHDALTNEIKNVLHNEIDKQEETLEHIIENFKLLQVASSREALKICDDFFKEREQTLWTLFGDFILLMET